MTNPSQNNSPANSSFAPDDTEAERRFEQYRSNDPFPDIQPALLNSADIYDYVAATGMIYPFYTQKMKPASYEVNLLGKCVYWDEQGKSKTEDIQQGKEFILKKNSIAFVTLEPMFRLPDYIALRFNLKIRHVYRGLLLGTGPLIDPGFVGTLSLPLHNLTTNDYKFKGGEALIWMEFTKLSPNRRWQQSSGGTSIIHQGQYIPFPVEKNKITDVQDYLSKAAPHSSIRSSIPDAIEDARRSAKEAVNTVRVITFAGIVSALLASYSLYDSYKQSASIIQDANSYVNTARKETNDIAKYQFDQEQKIQYLQQEIQKLNERIKELENSAKQSAQKPAIPNASPTATP